MTPMIDIVFLLLVFFLCTATFQRPESELAASLVVETPTSTGAGKEIDPNPPLDDIRVVGRRAGGQTAWSVNEGASTTDLARLTAMFEEVASVSTALPVTIDAATGVTLAELVAVYDAARSAGFVSVQIAADADSLGGN